MSACSNQLNCDRNWIPDLLRDIYGTYPLHSQCFPPKRLFLRESGERFLMLSLCELCTSLSSIRMLPKTLFLVVMLPFVCYCNFMTNVLEVNDIYMNIFWPTPLLTLESLLTVICLPPVTLCSSSHHGRSSPGGGLSVHRHPWWHRPPTVPWSSTPDLPLWPPLLEETVHSLQGERCLTHDRTKSRGFLYSIYIFELVWLCFL